MTPTSGAAITLDEAVCQPHRLHSERVDVWTADLRCLTRLPAELLDVLDPNELQRASAFHFEADRRRFCVGRALLRCAVGAGADIAPRDVCFEFSREGKPCLRDPDFPIEFNVSHSGDLVIVALSTGRSIGVDVEQIRDGRDFAALADTCFTRRERRIIFADPRDAVRRFYLYWACKEAWMKADGRGLTLPLLEHAVVEDEQPNGYAVEATEGRLPWRIRTFPTLPGYAAAIATEGSDWTIRLTNIEWSRRQPPR